MAGQTPASPLVLLLLLVAAAFLSPAPVSAQLSGDKAAAQLAAVKSGAVPMNGVNLGGWLVMEDWCDHTTPHHALGCLERSSSLDWTPARDRVSQASAKFPVPK